MALFDLLHAVDAEDHSCIGFLVAVYAVESASIWQYVQLLLIGPSLQFLQASIFAKTLLYVDSLGSGMAIRACNAGFAKHEPMRKILQPLVVVT